MRLIDADAVIKAIDKHTFDTDDGLCLDDDITCILEEVPTIGERKSGKWITIIKHHKDEEQEYGYYDVYCSACGSRRHIGWIGANYCPHCGARMEVEE